MRLVQACVRETLLRKAAGGIHVVNPDGEIGHMPKPSPTRYRTTNWAAYNGSLRKRGASAVWFDPEHVLACEEVQQAGAARNLLGCRNPDLPDVESALRSPAASDGRAGREPDPDGRLDWPAPDDSTLCRRQARIAVQIAYRTSGQPLNLLIDSTGIKFRGDGEWLARKHGSSRRRQWRKVHIAMDAGTGDVRAVEFASSRQGDSPLLPELLEQIPSDEPIDTVTAPSRDHALHDPAGQRMVPTTPGGAIAQSSNEVKTGSCPFAATAASGRKIVPLPSHETRSCGQPDIWAMRSGRGGRDTMSEAESRPG